MKFFSLLYSLFPEISLKQYLRAYLHRLRYIEYKTYYRNKIWELHYPDCIIKYYDVPSPASTNYLFFKKYINRKFDIIIDAGGFIGTFGLLMATRYPNSKIYIFEADPINYLKIKNNLELNGLKNVVIEPVGLWCKKEILKFNLSSSLNSSFLNNNIEDNLIKINVVSLNEYFNDIKNKIIFLKMNIEGAEIAAIQGALYFLQNNQVDLAVSTDHYVDGELTFSKIEELCTSLEMRVETVKDGFYVNTFATNISI